MNIFKAAVRVFGGLPGESEGQPGVTPFKLITSTIATRTHFSMPTAALQTVIAVSVYG
jgi:hypothetical protein